MGGGWSGPRITPGVGDRAMLMRTLGTAETVLAVQGINAAAMPRSQTILHV